VRVGVEGGEVEVGRGGGGRWGGREKSTSDYYFLRASSIFHLGGSRIPSSYPQLSYCHCTEHVEDGRTCDFQSMIRSWPQKRREERQQIVIVNIIDFLI
jgi:hypothetical protein